MDVLDLSLPTINKFSSDYLNSKEELQSFFTYNPFSEYSFRERYESIKAKKYKRSELVAYLTDYNRRFGANEKTMENIEKLLNEESVVIVGGQQAGLLTGPFYTISKIVSIICLAKEQEELLGKPIVPLFWIAGEDHDFLEINHVYTPEERTFKKKSYQDILAGKKMVSELEINKEKLTDWVRAVCMQFGETKFTKQIVEKLESYVERSKSYVDFFAFIVTDLFENSGLVLMNAADAPLRELESPYFTQLIRKHKEITSSVLNTQTKLREHHYEPILDITATSMNVFYHHTDGDRRLLYWNEESAVAYNDNGQQLALEQLLQIAEKDPQILSNNVITRPLMQEFLLPTLAFIAGPGEIAYWAELKEAFSTMNLEMPPVVPRLNFTLVEREIQSLLEELNVPLEDALVKGVEERKQLWLYEEEIKGMEGTLLSINEEYEKLHQKLHDVSKDMLPHLQPIFEKNWDRINREFVYIQRLMERSAYEKHETLMKKYERVQMSIRPDNAPQERMLNVFYFMNKYGLDLPKRMCELQLTHNGKHKVVFL